MSASTQHLKPSYSISLNRWLGQWVAGAAVFIAGLIPGHTAAQQPIVIQFSHVVTEDTAKGKAALRFKELAESRTRGRVRVEVYANSQLYKDREELDALRLGAVQMLAPSLSKLAGIGGADFELFDLPFLFKDRAAYRSTVDSPFGDALLKKLEPSGIKGLAFWDSGFKVITSNRPLHTVADFKNLKIRVQASKVLVDEMKRMGAQTEISPLINVREALKSGKLDAQENTPTNTLTQKLHEVQTHMTVSNHGYLAYAVIVNKPFWDKLPADTRTTLVGALRDASTYANGIAEQENAAALERIKSSGKLTVFVPTADAQKGRRAPLLPMQQQAKSRASPEAIQVINRLSSAPP